MPNTAIRIVAAAIMAGVLAGCGGSDGGGPGITFLRAVNAVSDSPTLNVAADDYIVAGTLGYTQVSNFSVDSFEGDTASRRVRAGPVLPGGGTGELVLDEPITVRRNTEATLVLTGTLADPGLLVVETPRRRRPLVETYFQFAHVADSVGALDFYVTAPDTDLAAAVPLYTLAPGSHGESVAVPNADLVVRLTPAGTLDVIFESATFQLENFSEENSRGDEFLFTVIDTLIPGAAPVKLLGGTSFGGSVNLNDVNGVSGLRVVHASQDTPAFDVVVGDAFASPVATSVAYKDATMMVSVPSGELNLNFTVPGSSSEFVFEEQVDLLTDAEHTLWLLDDYENLTALLLPADRRSIATEAKLRMVHAAPDGEFFSLYLGDAASDPPDRADRTLIDLRFGSASGYLSVLPGDYTLTLTERFYAAGSRPDDATETITIGPQGIALEAGDVITLLILPPETPGGPEVLEIYDDRAF